MAHQRQPEISASERAQPELADRALREQMERIQHKILVLSGKGGVDLETAGG